MNNDNERIYRALAKRYIDGQGRELLHELAAERAEKNDTSRMDKAVYKQISAKKHRIIWICSGLAACLIVALISLPVLGLLQNLNSGFSINDDKSNSQAPHNSAEKPLPNINLAPALPERLRISAEETDESRRVYILSDYYGDDVVLTAEYRESKPDADGLTPFLVNGVTVYYLSEDFYYLMTFKHDGILYTMTCRYEMETLLELCKNILNGL